MVEFATGMRIDLMSLLDPNFSTTSGFTTKEINCKSSFWGPLFVRETITRFFYRIYKLMNRLSAFLDLW